MRFVPLMLGGLLTVSACTPLSQVAGSRQAVTAGPVIEVRLRPGVAAQALPKTAADVASYLCELLDADQGDKVVLTRTGSGHTLAIPTWGDGHYKVRVTARDAGNQSITKGGPVTSGLVTVSEGAVTYPGGASALAMTIPLLDGTGERVANQVTVTYAGPTVTPDHYIYKLRRTSDNSEVASYKGSGPTSHFAGVPNGAYKLTAEAFNAADQSMTEGGAQESSNTVTVDGTATPTVQYSDLSSAFAVNLRLFIDKWTVITTGLPTLRRRPAAAVSNGQLLVIGGYVATANRLVTVESYDPAGTWSALTSLPEGRSAAAAVAGAAGEVYVIGGSIAGSHSNACLKYDPEAGSWVAETPFPKAREGLAAVRGPDGLIYALGGYEGAGVTLANVDAYDPVAKTWSPKAPMPVSRLSYGAAMVNGKIYVLGGSTSGIGRVTANHVYDPATDTWATKAPLPVGRDGAAVVAVNDRIYVIGGIDSANTLSDRVDVYDPATNTWQIASALPTPRRNASAGVIGNRIYVVGGEDVSGTPMATFEVYEP